MIKNNRIRMLFSVLLLSTTLQATTFKVQIDGGFIPGAEEGTKTKFAATVNFEQPLTLSQTPNPVNKVLLWGNPDATNHTKTQSSLQTVGTDRLVNATSPGDQLEYYTVGGVAHNNFPIDAEHGSLIFTQMAWGIKILDETGKQTLLNEIAILDLYNWETDNFDFSNPDGIRKPCERDTMGEIVYNFKKDGSSYILKNGESSHSFLGDGFDTSERGCDDAHEFKEVHITQTFDYLDNGCPKTYSVSLNGFYDYKDISNLYAQPKRTFWAREDWKSIGIIKLAIIEHDNNCNGGSGGGSGGGDKPGVDPTPPDNGGGDGGSGGGDKPGIDPFPPGNGGTGSGFGGGEGSNGGSGGGSGGGDKPGVDPTPPDNGGGSGGGSGGGDKPGVDPIPPGNGGGSGGGSGGSDCIDQCPDGCNNDCYCCEDEGNIDNGGSTDDNGSEDDTGNNPGDINDSENKPYHKSSASALGNISILLMILLTFLLVSKRLKMKLD